MTRSGAFLITTALAAFCLIALPTQKVEAARILGVFPAPSKSHLIIHCAIADALARAGHDVTVLSSQANVYKHAKYQFIHIEGPTFDQSTASDMVNNPQPMYKRFGGIMSHIMSMANSTMAHPKMQKFLSEHKENSFDLLILGYFMNDFYLGLGAHFRCPIVISFMIQPIFGVNSMVGSPHEVAYVPTLFSGLKQPMTFMNRVQNYVASKFEQCFLGPLMNYRTQQYYDLYFPSDRYPPLAEVRKNISLVLTNHHHISQGPIRPHVPAMIEIGGIQIKEKPDPLPADIAQLLDNSKEAVIYFSLGSNVQGSTLSPARAKIMFNVLSKLPYKVLWKWGDSDFPGQSSNIVYKSWLPQDDILAHPNVKLFITHGGQGSVVESQYHAVPMVGIPLFGDQPANMASVERAGFGLSADYSTLSEESFRAPIVEVIENPKYAEAVKQFSVLYRDRPMSARQMATFWVEYVIRHKGAKHLQSPALDLSDWQLQSFDVIAFLCAVTAGVVGVFVVICKCLCCRGKKAKKTSSQAARTKKNK